MSNGRPPKTVDLNAAIAEITELLRRVVGDKLIQRISLDPHLSRVNADPALLNWAFVSLATNALSTMLAGSELAVTTANVTLDSAAALELGVVPGAYAQVEFTLTGAGMRVPAAARDIVQRAHGAVAIHSTAGRVVVLVLFPTSAPADRRAYEPMILVVDRQPEVRGSMRKTLEQAGYEVLEAANEAEASAVLAACQADLVVTTGALEPSLAQSYPNLKTILVPTRDGYGLLDAVRREVGPPRLE
jgi:two-component system cell cycle sensor histidine kinase/response regulator CckA